MSIDLSVWFGQNLGDAFEDPSRYRRLIAKLICLTVIKSDVTFAILECQVIICRLLSSFIGMLLVVSYDILRGHLVETCFIDFLLISM